MDPKIIILSLITFFHSLFIAIWVGGLITIGATALPSVKHVLGKSPQTKQLMNTIQNRHSWFVYISIVGLVLTGFLMARRSPAFEGLFAFGNTYSAILTIKHIFFLVMVAIALFRSLTLGRLSDTLTPTQERLSGRLLLINIVLGVLVLLLSGFLTTSAAFPGLV
jgi:putative copper export protein